MAGNGPFVDPNKDRVTISIGIPMYNELEKGHLHETIDNAIAVGFDHIIILDDGSTDESWTVLQEYAARFPQIRVFRNAKNSVIYQGTNRWRFVVREMAKDKPDWVVVRAADQIYSYKATVAGGDHFRKRLTELYHKGVEMVRLPLAHLWRCRSWCRTDNVWGRDLNNHTKSPIWRFHPNYNYKGRIQTGAHMGWHHPSYFGWANKKGLIIEDINPGPQETWDLIILHLGHTTHNKKVLKFRWSMDAASIQASNNRSILMPPPSQMPSVKDWIRYNGYKGFYEFNMEMERVLDRWFVTPPPYIPKPVPQSMYYTILEYNPKRAKQYLNIYNRFYNM